MLVNNPWPHLTTYDVNNTSNVLNNGSSYLNNTKVDFDYWYCQFSDYNSFKIYPIKSLMLPEHFERVMKKDLFIILENANECFNSSVDGIYLNLVLDAGIPESQIILVSGGPDPADRIKFLADHMGKETIKFDWFSSQEVSVRDYFRGLDNSIEIPPILEQKEYTKKYLNLNRRWRVHRPAVLALLYERGLIDQGHNSFGKDDIGSSWDSTWFSVQNYFGTSMEIQNRLTAGAMVKKLLPLYLDTDDLVTNRAHLEASIFPFYSDTYFSIINETTYVTTNPNDGRFLTEKTFKAIGIGHPFLLVAPPRSLNLLKSLGYKTFSPLINEHYDLIKDDTQRLLAIINEAERLCKLQGDELTYFLDEARKICEFNRDRLFNSKSFVRRLV